MNEKDITLQDLLKEGLTLSEASTAIEAYYSCRIGGSEPMSAKRLAELIKYGKEPR